MKGPNTWRVVLMGKTGCGKSSLANTIFGEAMFKVNPGSDSKTRLSEGKTKTVNGQRLTLIDTPGIFSSDRSERDVPCEILSCMTECAPGPHAFLIVLLVEKFTEQEQALVDQMCKHFSEEVFRFATIVFTHGDQLPEDMKITAFVQQSKALSELVQKCGGRCHVVDNKYWKNQQQDQYRSNQFQVAEILRSLEKTVRDNNGRYFTNKKLEEVERDIQTEQGHFQTSGDMSLEECREQAKTSVLQRYIDKAQKRWSYLKYSVIAGLFAVSVVLIKFGPWKLWAVLPLSLPPGEDSTSAAEEALSSPSVTEVVQEVIAPIKTVLEYILERLEALYENIYNPHNPFE